VGWSKVGQGETHSVGGPPGMELNHYCIAHHLRLISINFKSLLQLRDLTYPSCVRRDTLIIYTPFDTHVYVHFCVCRDIQLCLAWALQKGIVCAPLSVASQDFQQMVCNIFMQVMYADSCFLRSLQHSRLFPAALPASLAKHIH